MYVWTALYKLLILIILHKFVLGMEFPDNVNLNN